MPNSSDSPFDGETPPGHPVAWDRFVRLYAPLLVCWAGCQGLREADAEDLAQIVLVKLIRLLPNYVSRDGQTFRGWLFSVCRNECRDFHARRATRPLPAADGLSGVPDRPIAGEPDEAEYRRKLVHRTLELIRPDFHTTTWNSFTRFVLDGSPAADVARELGTTANAVYLARNRVLTRVRAELAGFLE